MNRSKTRIVRRFTGAAIVAAALGIFGSAMHAQDAAPVVLLLDNNAIGADRAPNGFSQEDVNLDIASEGLRDVLPVFHRRVGQQVALPMGPAGHEGWFGLSAIPPAWASASTTGDPLADYVLAGAGLGSPDDFGNRGSLLNSVPNVAPLTASDVRGLIGRTVCGIVYASEIAAAPAGTSLNSPNLGIVAFTVSAVNASGSLIDVQILDEIQTCSTARMNP